MSDNIGFLVSDVARLIRRRFEERASVIGITRLQWRVLTALRRNEGINQGALAEILELDAMNVCRMVDRLQKSGFVERRPDPTDRRAWQLYLTENANPLIEELMTLGQSLFDEITHGMSEDEKLILPEILGKLQHNLKALGPNEMEHA